MILMKMMMMMQINYARMVFQVLEHMLADRQSNVSALRSMGHDLESLDLDLTQQRDLQRALDECVARYGAVGDVCALHRTELDRIESAVSRYRSRLDAFLSWLDATEHSAVMTDLISADVNIVQQQAAQQKVVVVNIAVVFSLWELL